MKLAKFFTTVTNPATWQQPIIFFEGSRYPANFFSLLLGQLRERGIITTPAGTLSRASIADAKEILLHTQQTLLGNAQFYWLGNIDELLTTKQKQLLLKNLINYQGSNVVALFVEEAPEVKNNGIKIACPASISFQEFLLVVRFLAPKLEQQPSKLELAQAIFAHVGGELDLDFCCMLIDYLDLTGIKFLPQLKTYTLGMLGGEQNLQGLAEAFFSKKETQFFTLWSQISPQYPDIFWLAYWSDLFWRAHHVISYIKQQKASLAKRMSFKLPYSFTGGTWKQYSPEHFKQLFALLYEIDFKIKTGFSFCFFEYVFATHFRKDK